MRTVLHQALKFSQVDCGCYLSLLLFFNNTFIIIIEKTEYDNISTESDNKSENRRSDK